MRVSVILSILAAATAASAQSSSVSAVDAPVATGNPIGASYVATLPNKKNSSVRGSVSAISATDGKGVVFSVAISGLPTEGGPFMYHIHEKPVPADGNCTGTGAHLDPYKRGEVPACNKATLQQCQTGDLSGKYGNITETSFSKTYTDLYSSTDPKNPAYFGNLSIVVHLSNKTRISCANFREVAAGVPNSTVPVSVGTSSGYAIPTSHNETLSYTATATGTGAGPTTGSPISPTTPLSTAGAPTMVAGVGVLAAGVVALML